MDIKIEEYGRLVNSKVLEGQMEVLHEVIGMLETELQFLPTEWIEVRDGSLFKTGMEKAKGVLEQKAREIGTDYVGCLRKELNPSE